MQLVITLTPVSHLNDRVRGFDVWGLSFWIRLCGGSSVRKKFDR